MEHTKGKWQADTCLDANGFHTIRLEDGTPHGNTDEQPVATVYTEANARRICQCANSHDDLVGLCKSVIAGNVDIGSVKRLLAEIESED